MLIGTVSCIAFVLSHRTGGRQGREGHQLAVVAYRDGQLYCGGEEAEEEEEGGSGRDRGKLYNFHTDGGEQA